MTASYQDPAMGEAFHEQFGGSPKHDAVPELFEAGWKARTLSFEGGLSEYQQGAIDALTEAAKTIGLDPADANDKGVAKWLMSQVDAIKEQAKLTAGAGE